MDPFFSNGEGRVFLILKGKWSVSAKRIMGGVYLPLKRRKENANKSNKERNKNPIFKMLICKRVHLRSTMTINFYMKQIHLYHLYDMNNIYYSACIGWNLKIWRKKATVYLSKLFLDTKLMKILLKNYFLFKSVNSYFRLMIYFMK